MVDELRSLRRSSVVAINGVVFTNPDGSPISDRQLGLAWRRARAWLAERGVKLPERGGWHVLRHTAAARLLTAGVPVKEAAEALGHTPAMLLTTYAHVLDRSAADDRIRAALGG
jgi:integrase